LFKCGADSVFSTFTGTNAVFLLIQLARAFIRNSSFRDIDLAQEIFDVSFGSSVRLENCTFTNITVPNNDYVSTSGNDWAAFQGQTLEMIYYPEDDAGPFFDFKRYRASDSSIADQGVSYLFTEAPFHEILIVNRVLVEWRLALVTR
jgi:hypothetical protein